MSLKLNTLVIIILIILCAAGFIGIYIQQIKYKKLSEEYGTAKPKVPHPPQLAEIYYKDDDIRAIIAFIITEYEQGRLKLGKRSEKNDIFISFLQEDIGSFTKDFYSICASRDSGMLSDSTYKAFTDSFISKVKESKNTETNTDSN